MSKAMGYHIGCLLYAFLQGFLWFIYIFSAIALSQEGVSDLGTIVLIHIVAWGIIVGGSFLDILIRKINYGNLIERLLLSIVASPLRFIFEISTISQYNTSLHLELFERGIFCSEYYYEEPSFKERLYYILFNRSTESSYNA